MVDEESKAPEIEHTEVPEEMELFGLIARASDSPEALEAAFLALAQLNWHHEIDLPTGFTEFTLRFSSALRKHGLKAFDVLSQLKAKGSIEMRRSNFSASRFVVPCPELHEFIRECQSGEPPTDPQVILSRRFEEMKAQRSHRRPEL